MSRLPISRAGLTAALVVLSITGSGGAALAAPTSHVVHRTGTQTAADAVPTNAAASWLVGQLTGGLVHNDQYGFDDDGLSIDVALALDEVGGHASTVHTVADAVAATLPGYIGDGSTEAYAGSTAKALVLAQIAGEDPTSFGGVDLVSRLEGLVRTDATAPGRIQDTSAYGDYANVLGQSLAARGLTAAGSESAGLVTDFLLEQQCSAGWFRDSFSASDATDQTCDGDTSSTASTDATAYAVINLLPQAADPAVKSAIASAVAWLKSTQHTDGSFGGAGPTAAANANSTGLAGYALTQTGNPGPAAAAAVWIRQQQLAGIGVCKPFRSADDGALAYDPATRTAAVGYRITKKTQDQFRRATAQALPALLAAPAGPENGATSGGELNGSDYRERAVIRRHFRKLAPGSPVCASLVGASSGTLTVVGADGKATTTVTAPAKEKSFKVKIAAEDYGYVEGPDQTFGPKTIPFTLAHPSVAAKHRQVVVVHGLLAGETVRVRTAGHLVAEGNADSHGRFTGHFTARRNPGREKVTVTGQFADIRRATKTFQVTR